MKGTIYTTLHQRELNSPAVRAPSQAYRPLYSNPAFISDLDIVNELDGHSGCVNALSWSKSGNLLASGSDDQHLNIHQYQPSDDGSKQFKLVTTVATGHTQNIFSVKFMPYQNDRICVTAAGDGEVRVFDLEHSGGAREASSASSIASQGRRRGRNTVYNGVKYLSDGDTDCRIYRSHGDRVKRIVTESSPNLFLTCSEDGEVRQWDLRQPSSAYPAPRGSRYGASSDDGVPPPLISYKRYNLDLNTISCSPSQPHYIALGGAHLHCFLHDRRMTGRDRLREAGKTLSPSASRTLDEEELMAQATQCVRKFAPRGQQGMKRTENGHITACKISDARPDEMVVSWSGDHIYSFDLVRSPDAREAEAEHGMRRDSESRVRVNEPRKRKRKANTSDVSIGRRESAAQATSRPRTESATSGAALRVRYQNGQSEDIPISAHSEGDDAQEGPSLLNAKQREAQRIAKTTVQIRSAMFGHDGVYLETRCTRALGRAASIMSDIDEVMRDWRYPMEPSQAQVGAQRLMRLNRERTRRFVQAAGTLARMLGGQLQTGSTGPSPLLAHFASVETRSHDLAISQREQFGYDFLKAILLWLESGVGRLIEGFTRPADMPTMTKAAARLPIPEADASTEAVDEYLIPYLLRLAQDSPIVDVQVNRFEVDTNRHVFPSEKAAVLAFAAAVKIPFADLSSAVVLAEEEPGRFQAQDRNTAMSFWGRKVSRGLLLNAAEGIDFVTVDRAFGGLGRVVRDVVAEEQRLADPAAEPDEAVERVEFLGADGEVEDQATADALADATREARGDQPDQDTTEMAAADPSMSQEGDAESMRQQGLDGIGEDGRVPSDADDDDDDRNDDNEEEMLMAMADEADDFSVLEDEDDEDENDDEDEDTDDDSSEPSEIDGVPNPNLPRFMYTSAFERRRRKERVEYDVLASSATRTYRGHCNVRTVKDVNFFGLDDEYVVSGSDDGNLFIWDRKSSELVNILEGDGEVVNVAQGHPYEPMLAVSGIDHTIKIFSPDARARAAARLNDGISAHDASQFSSIAWPSRMGRRVSRRTAEDAGDSTVTSEPAVEDEDEYVAPNGLASRKRMHDQYRIVNKNDVERQGGNQDAFITVPHSHLLQLLFGGMGNVFPDFQ